MGLLERLQAGSWVHGPWARYWRDADGAGASVKGPARSLVALCIRGVLAGTLRGLMVHTFMRPRLYAK